MEHFAILYRYGYNQVFRSEHMFLINSTVVRKTERKAYLMQHNWAMPSNVHLFLLLSDFD